MSSTSMLMLSDARSVHVHRWVAALAARGWEITLLTGTGKYYMPVPGAKVIRFEAPPLGLRYPYRWLGRYRAFFRSVLKQSRADVVHMHWLYAFPLRAEDFRGTAVVLSVWGSDVVLESGEPDEFRAKKTKMIEIATAVTATTNFLAEECRKYCDCPSLAIEVIPFGVETRRFVEARQKVTRQPDRFRIGFVKHLNPKYGAEYLIRAIPAIAAEFPRIEVVMAGVGPLKESLVALAAELGVSGHITWLGWVPYDQIPELHMSMDVSVMPSVVSESFGVAAIEAQAAGVPVVASDYPGIREAVRDGVTGILVPPRDSGAIASAVCRLLGDEALRMKMGRAGQEFVQQNFEWDRCVDAMEAVYGRVVRPIALETNTQAL